MKTDPQGRSGVRARASRPELPHRIDRTRRSLLGAIGAASALGGCTALPAGNGLRTASPGAGGVHAGTGGGSNWASLRTADTAAVVDRLSWGVNDSTLAVARTVGLAAWLDAQFNPVPVVLPAEAQALIDGFGISRRDVADAVRELDQMRRNADAKPNEEERKLARNGFVQGMNVAGREAAQRHVLRALYSPNALHEQMSWFWFNHFNVHLFKGNVRVTVGDYEERAIRPHALGRFRDLLGATSRHPAMLIYLDNAQNAVNRINENYARELLELHTLGVDAGYSQRDVQELARVLTGVGVNFRGEPPKLAPAMQAQHVAHGVFEFNPARHDFGDKQVLGHTIRGRGLAELDEVLDLLAAHPATARRIARKLAQMFVADEPPAALVERIARAFAADRGGDIAGALRTLIASPEFAASLGGKFKDPVHYVFSAVRLAYDQRPIVNPAPVLGWLNRLGQQLYGRQTPDGYPLTEAAWSSAGQLNARFEVARAIGSGSAGLFRADGATADARPAFPQLANATYYGWRRATLAEGTRRALEQAVSPQDWNGLLLAAPEFMQR
jgi:uncharacterized protein (DUF1800 family)